MTVATDRRTIALLAGVALSACGTNMAADAAGTHDTGVVAVTDTGPNLHDTGTTLHDTGTVAPSDSGTPPRDSGTVVHTDSGTVTPTDAGTVSTGDGGLRVLGADHTGQYHLGPVEWTGSFNNACSPYPSSIQTLEGGFLAGLSNELAATGSLCDACVEVTTGRGHHLVLRAVTYGVSGAPGDMDVSQAAYTVLTEGEYPRAMTWHLVTCPGTDPVYFQFQTGASIYWTSFWVRNPRIAIEHVEVTSANHTSAFTLRRQTDGTFNDDGGFGAGAFTLRIVGVDGSVLVQSFASFTAGALVRGTANFP